MREDAYQITRRSLMGLIAAVSVGASTTGARANETAITVQKNPSCGCCSGWVQHLRGAGFKVRVEESSDLEPVRVRLRVPPELVACHTAEAGGYILEGHVPAAAVRRLLSYQGARGAGHAGRVAGHGRRSASALYGDVVRSGRLKNFHALSRLKGDRLIGPAGRPAGWRMGGEGIVRRAEYRRVRRRKTKPSILHSSAKAATIAPSIATASTAPSSSPFSKSAPF